MFKTGKSIKTENVVVSRAGERKAWKLIDEQIVLKQVIIKSSEAKY